MKQENINMIRKLHFKWNILGAFPPTPPDGIPVVPVTGQWYRYVLWTGVWRTLASMSGLQDLRVELGIPHRGWRNLESHPDAATTLDPIMEVTAPSNFELVVPSVSYSNAALWETLPCRVVTADSRTRT